MIETPPDLIETPSSHSMDRAELLADVLRHIRLSGAIFMRGVYGAPWALETPSAQHLIDMLAPGWERLIPFHAIRRGVAWVHGNGIHNELQLGDLAILPHAHQHLLGAGPLSTRSTPIVSVLPPLPWTAMPLVELDGGGTRTEIVCGYFRCDDLLFNTVLRHLPPIFVVRPEGAVAEFFTATMNYVMSEAPFPGKEAPMAARMPELLLAEALRIYSETAPAANGWLAATLDPVISRTLAILHRDPAHDWSVEELARQANTSRSVLGERFRTLLGQSPMQYLIEWRMQLAAGLLRSSSAKIADIAEQVGYGSDAAFSRAFHRHVGAWPADWRQSAAR
jgi:AraC-like DNA-binding protein